MRTSLICGTARAWLQFCLQSRSPCTGCHALAEQKLCKELRLSATDQCVGLCAPGSARNANLNVTLRLICNTTNRSTARLSPLAGFCAFGATPDARRSTSPSGRPGVHGDAGRERGSNGRWPHDHCCLPFRQRHHPNSRCIRGQRRLGGCRMLAPLRVSITTQRMRWAVHGMCKVVPTAATD